MPEGHKGLILSESTGLQDSWTAERTFAEFTIWNHDTAPTMSDAAFRSLEWLSLSQLVCFSYLACFAETETRAWTRDFQMKLILYFCSQQSCREGATSIETAHWEWHLGVIFCWLRFFQSQLVMLQTPRIACNGGNRNSSYWLQECLSCISHTKEILAFETLCFSCQVHASVPSKDVEKMLAADSYEGEPNGMQS